MQTLGEIEDRKLDKVALYRYQPFPHSHNLQQLMFPNLEKGYCDPEAEPGMC